MTNTSNLTNNGASVNTGARLVPDNFKSIQLPQIQEPVTYPSNMKFPEIKLPENVFYNSFNNSYYNTQEDVEDINLLSDIEDPTQTNSILDIIASTFDPYETGGMTVMDLVKSATSISDFNDKYNALWDRRSETFVKGITEWWNQTTVQPYEQLGGFTSDFFKVAGINHLVSMGESLDFLSNMVKAALPVNWTTAKNYTELQDANFWERMKIATGIGYEGRYSFDMDIDLGGDQPKTKIFNLPLYNTALNMVGEIITDPLNLISFGTSLAAKTAAKGIGETTADVFIKNADDFAEVAMKTGLKTSDIAQALVNKQVTKAFADGNAATISRAVRSFIKHLDVPTLVKKGIDVEALTDLLGTVYKQSANIATNNFNLRIIRSALSAQVAAQSFDKVTTAIAGGLLTPVIHTLRLGKDLVATFAHNKLINGLAKYVNKNGTLDITDIKEAQAYYKTMASELRQSDGITDEMVADDLFEELYAGSITKQIDDLAEVINTSSYKSLYDNVTEYIKTVTNGKIVDITDYTNRIIKIINTMPNIDNYLYKNITIKLSEIADTIDALNKLSIRQNACEDLLNKYNLNVLKTNTEHFMGMMDYFRKNMPSDMGSLEFSEWVKRVNVAYNEFATSLEEFATGFKTALHNIPDNLRPARYTDEYIDSIFARFKNVSGVYNTDLFNTEFDNIKAVFDDIEDYAKTLKQHNTDMQNMMSVIRNSTEEVTKNFDTIKDNLIKFWSKDPEVSINYKPNIDLNVSSQELIKIVTKDYSEYAGYLKPISNVDYSELTDDLVVEYENTILRLENKISEDYTNELIKSSVLKDEKLIKESLANKERLAILQNKIAAFETSRLRSKILEGQAYIQLHAERFTQRNNIINCDYTRRVLNLFNKSSKAKKAGDAIFNMDKNMRLKNIDEYANLSKAYRSLESYADSIAYQQYMYRRALYVFDQDPKKAIMFIQALQNFGEVSPLEFSDYKYTRLILNRMQAQSDNMFMFRKANQNRTVQLLSSDAKMQSVFLEQCNNDPVLYAQRLAIIKDAQHSNPVVDTWITRLRLQYEDPELYAQLKATPGTFFTDIETSNLALNSDVWDIGIDMMDNSASFYKSVKLLESDITEETLFSLEKLEQLFGKNDPVTLKEYTIDDYLKLTKARYGTTNINEVYTQEDLLKDMNEFLIKNNCTTNIGMNNTGFDDIVLANAAYRTDTFKTQPFKYAEISNSVNNYDVYNTIRKAQGTEFISPLDATKVNELRAFISNHALKYNQDKILYLDYKGMVNTISDLNKYADELVLKGYFSESDEFITAIKDLYNRSGNYIDNIEKGIYDNAVIENVFGETNFNYQVDALSKKLNVDSDTLAVMLQSSNRFTSEELSAMLKGTANPDTYARFTNYYRTVRLQEILGYKDKFGNDLETFDEFAKRINNTYGDITNVQKILGFDSAYTHLWKSSVSDRLDVAGKMLTNDMRMKWNKAATTMDDIIRRRIKDSEAIFKIDLFTDFNDLKIQTQNLLNLFSDNPNHWASAVNLNNIYSRNDYIALYYTLLSEASELPDVASRLSSIRKYVFLEYSTVDKIIDSEARNCLGLAETYYDESYENLTAIQRILKLENVYNKVPNADPARTIAAQLMEREFSNIREFKQLSDADIRRYLNQQNHITSNLSWNITINRLNTILNEDGSINTENLFRYLTNGRPWITLRDIEIKPEDLIDDIEHPVVNSSSRLIDYKSGIEHLLNSPKELAEQGIAIKKIDDTIYIGLGNNHLMSYADAKDFELGGIYNNVRYAPIKSEYYTLDPLYWIGGEKNAGVLLARKHTEELNELMRLTYQVTGGRFGGISTVYSTSDFIKDYNALPKAFKDMIIDSETFLSSDFFKTTRWNEYDWTPQAFRKTTVPNVHLTLQNDFKYAALTDKLGNLYMRFMTSDAIASNMKDIFKGCSDKDVINAIQNATEMVPVVIVEGKGLNKTPLGYYARRLEINNIADLKAAYRLDAKLVPYPVYNEICQATESASALQKMAQKFVRLYKFGMLSLSAGTVVRNEVDSVGKTMISTGDPLGTLSYNFKAITLNKQYDDVVRLMNTFDPDIQLSPTGIKKFFDKYKDSQKINIDYDTFMYIHGFRKSALGAGETAQAKLFNKSVQGKSAKNILRRVPNTLLKPMEFVEQNARLGMLLQLEDQGYTTIEALSKIDYTHFNYNVMSPAMRKIQLVIPFANFRLLNFNWWLDRYMDSPALIRTLGDTVKAQWNGMDMTEEDYQKNRSFWYAMLNGTIPLTDEGLGLKMSWSFMDAFNLLTDPANSVLDSLFAPYKAVVEAVLNRIEDDEIRQGLSDGSYKIRFGKLKGQPVSVLLDSENSWYTSYIMEQDWFKEKYEYEYIYVVTQALTQMQNLPSTSEEVAGLLSAGIFSEDDNVAREYLKDIGTAVAKDTQIWPFFGVLDQRFFDEESTSKSNASKLEGHPIQQALGRIMPSLFKATKRFDDYVQEEKTYSSNTSRYSYQNRKSYYPTRAHNYYAPSSAGLRMKYSSAAFQFKSKMYKNAKYKMLPQQFQFKF